ncbi:MAG: hypothetical protein HYU27_10495 [Acidobacteria bacterium]|nr:hypothetical protein [Acidobacteriota bacterium]
MALLFVPLLLGLRELYLWAQPEEVSRDALLQYKSAYLNAPFFLLRTLLYFATWVGVAYYLNKWSAEQDRTADPSLLRRLQLLSGAGLVLYVLTATFSSIDWVMSLEPHWHSTIYGMLFMAGHVLEGMAFVIVVAHFLAGEKPLSDVISRAHFHDLGNLLMGFLLFWAYIAFSQFLIVWSENLKEEIPWYFSRTRGGWQGIGLSLIMLQFALPFILLLSRATKRRSQALALVALVVLAMRLVDLFWVVAPAFHPTGLSVHWLDLVSPVGIGGIWIWTFLWLLKKRALLPLHDPRFSSAVGGMHGE